MLGSLAEREQGRRVNLLFDCLINYSFQIPSHRLHPASDDTFRPQACAKSILPYLLGYTSSDLCILKYFY
jgi:hypothetical protein